MENADGSGATARTETNRQRRCSCHFLHRYYMDRSHPSRLPSGSLRSALTGPGRDPERNVLRGGNGRAWLGTREVEHTAVGAGQLCLQTTNSQIYS